MFSFDYEQPKIIAEIGCNHMGNFEIAKELVVLAKQTGAGYVKFQKRNNRELLSAEQYDAPHPVSENSYGSTYGEHREFLEFTTEQHRDLNAFCDESGVIYSTSVWDVNSAEEIVSFQPEFIKVPSACNNNYDMLEVLRDTYKGQVQISVGMTTKKEAAEIVEFFDVGDHAKSRLLVYSCTSGYPVPAEDVALLEINYLYKEFGDRVQAIGFSGHHLGIALDVAAYTLGARWVERHFTKDRTWKGTDHAASLEPSGFTKLVRDLNSAFSALNYKRSDILPIESIQREKLKSERA